MRLRNSVRALAAVVVASVVASISPFASAETEPLPGVLVKFLERNRLYRLLTLDDVGDDFKEAFETRALEFTPLVIDDANGDGRSDLVVVLVKPGGEQALQHCGFPRHRPNFSFGSDVDHPGFHSSHSQRTCLASRHHAPHLLRVRRERRLPMDRQ